ncbi:hypothetical protein [Botrimarina mediterranea]|uniref:hypothetical protein n=1 Tax=Botrimarina mediterranea TaxID=2528022 RepID=UPI0011A42BE2|nr:hypothetical protein [Botrimarina mediterranea]
MSSRLQEPFLRDVVASFRATSQRLVAKVEAAKDQDCKSIIDQELAGLFHGLLVILDGGSALADEGLIAIVDEDGVSFDRGLHETYLFYWQAVDKVPHRHE